MCSEGLMVHMGEILDKGWIEFSWLAVLKKALEVDIW